jgi:hypothetical protein
MRFYRMAAVIVGVIVVWIDLVGAVVVRVGMLVKVAVVVQMAMLVTVLGPILMVVRMVMGVGVGMVVHVLVGMAPAHGFSHPLFFEGPGRALTLRRKAYHESRPAQTDPMGPFWGIMAHLWPFCISIAKASPSA